MTIDADPHLAELHIRRASAADNLLLADLGRKTFLDTFGADNTPENMAAYLAASFGPEKQAAELADPDTLFLIAEIGTEAVGFARLREGPPALGSSALRPMEIVRFYSRQDWIGRGVGAALMRACLDEAQERGCDRLWLDVWEHNPRAQAFYRKWGFELMGTQEFRLGEELQTDWIMERPVRREEKG
jgi:diamine N-acetyltransferase